MTTTPASIKEMFPEFASKSDDFVTIYIESAKLMICAAMYGPRYDLALSYLTAHLMKVTIDRGKELTASKVGDLSRSYKPSNLGDNYNSTGYGKEFSNIKKSLINKKVRPIYGSAC